MLKTGSIILVGAMTLAAGSLAAPAKPGWLTTVSVTDKGAHVLGNPAAPNKVVEYLSYTCGHCANFELNEAPAFKTQYVATGKASLEIRNMLLNPIDLTAAMLARCGGKGRFFGNQKHLFATQSVWLGKAKNISAATQAHLKSENYTAYMTGVYNEIGDHAATRDHTGAGKNLSGGQGGAENRAGSDRWRCRCGCHRNPYIHDQWCITGSCAQFRRSQSQNEITPFGKMKDFLCVSNLLS
jgi:Thioredoxin